jgi:hypothetical protein
MAEIIGNLTITKNRTEQKINLRELLGAKPTSSQVEQFAREAIEVINQRTLNGDDINGETFEPYSEEYARKKGVSVDSVDLFLTGNMLDAMDITNQTPETVTIGIKGGEDALKSFAHNTGDGKAKKREFFGITKYEAERIASKIKEDKKTEAPKPITLSALRQALNLLDIEVE